MNKNYFEGIYDDFFGVEKATEKEQMEMRSQEEMTSLFDRINTLYITDESKNLLKKIIEYERKYNEEIEKNYIPFHIVLETNKNDLKSDIEEILSTSAIFFNYIEEDKKEISLYEIDNNFDAGFISLSHLTGINLEEDKTTKTFFHNLEEYLKKDLKSMILVTGTKEEITNLEFFI